LGFHSVNSLILQIEAEAVKTILTLCEQDPWQLLNSQVIEFEIGNTADEVKRMQLQLMMANAVSIIRLNPTIIARTKFFETAGLTTFDAMHLACAETQADVFLTVDDKSLKKARTLTSLTVNNPLNWLSEVLSTEAQIFWYKVSLGNGPGVQLFRFGNVVDRNC
jgi:predicted nucleic acid-binding protein